jgi:hypothetical protein
MLNHGGRPRGRRNGGFWYFGDESGVMRVRGAHWLDYDSVAVAVLVAGIGIVLLAALSI